jgi:hypothetical protein
MIIKILKKLFDSEGLSLNSSSLMSLNVDSSFYANHILIKWFGKKRKQNTYSWQCGLFSLPIQYTSLS